MRAIGVEIELRWRGALCRVRGRLRPRRSVALQAGNLALGLVKPAIQFPSLGGVAPRQRGRGGLWVWVLPVVVFLIAGMAPVCAQEVDTDGDGLTDKEETEIYGTDPKKADSNGNGIRDLLTTATLDGVKFSHRAGSWTENEHSPDLAGRHASFEKWEDKPPRIITRTPARVEYEFDAPAADAYRFGFKYVCPEGSPPASYKYRLHFLVDHVPVKTLDVPAVTGTSVWSYVAVAREREAQFQACVAELQEGYSGVFCARCSLSPAGRWAGWRGQGASGLG